MARDYSKESRLIVFFGRSGCGKSTSIRELLRSNKFKDRKGEFVVVDEITRVREILFVWQALWIGKTVLAASHVSKFFFWPLSWLYRSSLYQLDSDKERLRAYLRTIGVSFSEDILAAYIKRYKATFTDLQIILEREPAKSLDESFLRFHRACSISI